MKRFKVLTGIWKGRTGLLVKEPDPANPYEHFNTLEIDDRLLLFPKEQIEEIKEPV